MPNYLWLGVYSPSPPRHSSTLCLTYDLAEDAYATIFHLVGRPPTSACALQRSVALRNPVTDEALFHSRILLGIVSDAVLQVLGDYIREACALLNDAHGHAPLDDWALLVIRSFEDSRFLPAGALVRAQQALR
ncbi:hypothetical protein AURDEDRAFT_156184 [Auricularia subglabra TFB-10046 SS5]|nr:hypothetical protein AURDEDRAFT_156184 [Auricularia subglabra TFB-10046 SS5]